MARQKLLLDRYRIIEAIGSGGYGTVQHTYDTRLKRDVAIKSIPLSEADLARARLLATEARLAELLAENEGMALAATDEAQALAALMGDDTQFSPALSAEMDEANSGAPASVVVQEALAGESGDAESGVAASGVEDAGHAVATAEAVELAPWEEEPAASLGQPQSVQPQEAAVRTTDVSEIIAAPAGAWSIDFSESSADREMGESRDQRVGVPSDFADTAEVESAVEDEDDDDAAFEAEFQRKLARSRHASPAQVSAPALSVAPESFSSNDGFESAASQYAPGAGTSSQVESGSLWVPSEPAFFQERERLSAKHKRVHEAIRGAVFEPAPADPLTVAQGTDGATGAEAVAPSAQGMPEITFEPEVPVGSRATDPWDADSGRGATGIDGDVAAASAGAVAVDDAVAFVPQTIAEVAPVDEDAAFALDSTAAAVMPGEPFPSASEQGEGESLAVSSGEAMVPQAAWEQLQTTSEQPQSSNDLATLSESIELDDDDLFDHIPGLEEARTAAQLSDPHIVTVYDCEVHNNVAYIIMEYVEGKTLTALLREAGDSITLDLVAAVVDAIALALEAAQAGNVLHLDIKPDNVLVNTQGIVKVTDFGLARLVEGGEPGSTNGGTIGYMPPEQMNLEDLDARTDEWALAAITYEMLSGTNPFIVPSLDDAEQAILEAELVYPSLCWDDLSTQADDIVFRALDPDPEERYSSAGAFADALVPLLGNSETGVELLADLVQGREEEPEEEKAPPKPAVPLVDRLGPWGGAAIGRILSALTCAFMAAVALANVNIGSTADAGVYGLATHFPIIYWACVAACCAAGAVFPSVGALVVFVLLGLVYVFNGAYLLGIALIVITILWWRYVGSLGIAQSACVLLEPLAGAVGFGALSPVMAGVFLPIIQSLATAAFAAFGALCFACLGSADLMNWDAMVNLRFAGLDLQAVFIHVATLPQTWCVAVSWVACAGLYSLFCARGTRSFDIAGSLVAAFVLLAGVCVAAGFGSAGASGSALLWGLPTPMALAGALIPGLLGVVCALMGVPDRARLAPEEWELDDEPAE